MRDLIEDLREATIGHDLDKVNAAFLSITSAKRMNGAKAHLARLLAGYEKGEIYNVEYKDAKDFLGRVVEETWRERTDRFWVGKGGNNPESAFLDYLGSIHGLHDVLSRKKKLDKMKPTTKISKYGTAYKVKDVNPEFINAAREIVNAAHPVALIVKELKTKVIKGRKPNPAAAARKAAQLAKKDMKTCACCFRSIARLKNGLIADHGYTLPRQWMKTASCPGRDFKPLEVSNEGLKYMVKQLKSRVEGLTSALAGIPKLKKLTRKKGWKGEVEVLTPDHPKWEQAVNLHRANLQQELKHTEDDLKSYQHKLDHWKPVPGA
jgi:hypothetical protein